MSAVAKILYKSIYWKIFQFGTSFIITIIFARALQAALSAEFYSLVYLLSLAISFFVLGLDIGLNFYLSRRQISPRTANRIIFIVVVLAVSVCLPLICLVYRHAHYPDISLPELLLFSAFNISGGLLTNLSGTLFTAYGRNYFTAKVSFFANIAMIVLSLAISLLFSGSYMVKGLFLVYFLFSFLPGVFLFIRSWGFSLPESDGKTGTVIGFKAAVGFKDIFRFSFAAFITNFIFFAGARICLYLIPYWAPPAGQGNYIQAYKLVEYMTGFVALIYYPLIAVVAGERTVKPETMVLFMVRLSNTFVLLVVLFILATGWFLFPFIFGKSFSQVYTVFIWLIPGVFAACSSSFFTAYYFGKGFVKYNLRSSCIQFISGLLLFFIFIRAWGLNGAAFAFSLSCLFSLLYDCLVFKDSFTYRLQDILFVHKADIDDIGLFIKRLLK